MKRREFIVGLAATAGTPFASSAQERVKRPRVGFLMHLTPGDPDAMARVAAFLQGLQELGWATDRNIQIDYRWAAGQNELYRKYALELVALRPDVLVTTVTDTVRALQRATRTIPIVFTSVIDPVGSGLITNLSHPGGNATGFSLYEFGISGKWLELLKQIAPSVTRVAVLRDRRWTVCGHSSERLFFRGGAASARCARGQRHRPFYRRFRREGGQRPYCHFKPNCVDQSRFDYQAHSPASLAGDLSVS